MRFQSANAPDHGDRGVKLGFRTDFAEVSGPTLGYARHGRDCNGVQVPCTRLEISRSSVYQMTTPIEKVLDEGNCGEATDRGEEACDRVRKRRVCLSPPGRDLVKAARLRTETSYKAGPVRRACPSVRSRFPLTDQVNDELVQRNITHLSGEICIGGMRVVVAPASRACPKPSTSSSDPPCTQP
jgi:hypothetical protein